MKYVEAPMRGLGLSCLTALLTSATVLGCGGVPMRSGSDELRDYTDDYDKAMAEEADLPSKARTVDDIKKIARARRIVGACVPGKGGVYTKEWFERHRGIELNTLDGKRTVEDMAADCSRALKKLAGRTVEACGARYVQLERHLSDDDSWTDPQVTKTSEGWYMTPCDRTPGSSSSKELKGLEETLHDACEDPKATLYFLAKWTEQPGGRGMVATVACMVPRQERSDWLSGNPALGIK
jgi:hypothetical protein